VLKRIGGINLFASVPAEISNKSFTPFLSPKNQIFEVGAKKADFLN